MSLISDNRKPSNVKYMVSCRCNPGRASVQLALGVISSRSPCNIESLETIFINYYNIVTAHLPLLHSIF